MTDTTGNNPAGELTSTLARLDQQWKIQQSSQPRSRWTKLVINKEADVVEETTESIVDINKEFVYLLEPPYNSVPSCVIVFTGGAGLGAYPQIAYNELLLRISNRLNAAIITAPYNVGLDHFQLAKSTGELSRRAIIHCQDAPSRLFPSTIPVFSLSHSLGSKLSCIYVAATNQKYDGVGFISFNNFGFAKTIGMAKEFAETIRKNTGMARDNLAPGMSAETLNSIFNFAEMAVNAVGIDFSPTQQDMNRLIEMRYSESMANKTRLFTFDDDTLENSQDFYDVTGGRPQVSGLPGTHLTPVYFKLSIEDMELPEETREIAMDAMGGFRGASFGNEDELEALVNEICDWIKGKPPSRKPNWLREKPMLTAEKVID
jgi:hypothetical protein